MASLPFDQLAGQTPMDFTFVCPTELHAFQEKLEEFEKRDVAVVGCSV